MYSNEIWGMRTIIERAILKGDNVKRVIKDYSIHYKVTQKYIREHVQDILDKHAKGE